MSLGNLLLQPQRLQRESHRDPQLQVVQDLLRLLTLLAEDAADDGPLAGVTPTLLSRLATRVQSQSADGVEAVQSALKTHFQPTFLYFEGLVEESAGLTEDPGQLIGLIRELLDGVKNLLASLDQAQIRTQLDFIKGLIEDELGFDNRFVAREIGTLLDDLVDLWQQLPSDISAKRRRRQKLAIRIVKRLRRHLLQALVLPEIDTARAAAQIHRLLQSSGIADLFGEIHCAIDKFDQALDAANDIREALPLSVGGGSVGAALIEPEGAARYCWYASWLLSDIDLPLLSLGDIDDKRLFAINIRFRNSVKKPQAAVSKYIFSTLSLEQQREVMAYTGGTTEPDDSLILMLVAHINMLMQQGPIYRSSRFNTPDTNQSEQDLNAVPFEFRLRNDEIFSLPEDLETMSHEYVGKQQLFLYNRRFLEWIYGRKERDDDQVVTGPKLIDSLCGTFWRYLERKTIGIRRDVYISGDRRYLMCDDIPIYTVAEGSELKWEEAPLFIDKESGRWPVEGATYYRFTRVSALACDIMAQVVFGLEQTARPIWHLAKLQPGHEIGTGILSGMDILHALSHALFGKPISGYESIGKFGKWLANDWYGPRSLALFVGSFQGLHTAATAGNGWWFWVTTVLGDYIRIAGHNSILTTGRDLFLTFFTLLNSSPSNSGDSSLPDNPAANHLKQAGIISPMNMLFAFLLLLNHRREDHSIEIWSAGGIGDRRSRAFGLWLGGGLGFGILSGLAGSIVSQFIAWQEDWELLGITILESIGGMILGFWFYEYFLIEGDTADGTMAANGTYKGYPAKANSPYRLPFADGEALYMGQGNNGLFSHNEITNLGGNWQFYAYDLGHDHRQIVRAMRGGTVVAFQDINPDNNDQNANFIIIRHDTAPPVADHDDPFGTGTPVVTYARYWHGAQNGVTNVLGATPMGVTVNQGDPIMEADDTGTSFHSHLHIYVATDDGSGNAGNNSIPFVFDDVDNDSGRMEFLTWYRAGS
ncbi:MAG: hypothetical protein GY802_01345 [Gammaproteobacteria bacterium]|nr:hypothetical protein [Gammaproteobacteria bacterium]MCP4386913.1 hypothetical protein [Gammaproteobacteria bacterium]